MSRRAAVAAALVAVALGTAAVAMAQDSRTAPVTRTLLLVSGLDDHGLLELAQVPLLDRARGTPVGAVADGTLVRVVEVAGSWHRVRSAEGPPVEGWLDDYRLRGVVHLVGASPSCRPVVTGVELEAGSQAELVSTAAGGVLVRLVSDPRVGGVVPRAAVRQLPPRGPGGCDDVPAWATDGHLHAH